MTTITITPENDTSFTAADQHRLVDLLAQWRSARERGPAMTVEDQTELTKLVDRELEAATQRSAALARELRP